MTNPSDVIHVRLVTRYGLPCYHSLYRRAGEGNPLEWDEWFRIKCPECGALCYGEKVKIKQWTERYAPNES